MLYVGIDVSKYKHDISVIDHDGTIIIRHLKISNNHQVFSQLQNVLAKFKVSNGEDIQIGLEDTGHYSFNILHFLRKHGFQTFSYNPLLIKEFAKHNSLRKTKTDKKDAMTIARKLREDIDKTIYQFDSTMTELKYATRNVSRIKDNCTKLKVNFTRILDIIFPELAPSLPSNSAKHSLYIYEVLKNYPSPERIRTAHLTKLTNIIYKTSHGHHGRNKAIELKELSKKSIGSESNILEFELIQTIESIQYFTKIRKIAEKEVEKIMFKLDSPILTIPGIGIQLGSIILSEIRNISNFKNPGQLLAYAGAEPSISTSGTVQTEVGYMVKRGSAQLRWALLEAAKISARHSPTMKSYLHKKEVRVNILMSQLAMSPKS